MIFQGKSVLVYLEEDNIARAYFRIRPLMTQEGPVDAEILASFPDDGYLRIVPDKNEQHTFKERMRALCGLCLLDLRHLPADANKIRTNKNYSPARGETNQYIVYSDAIRAISADDTFYQVVSEENISSAFTPSIYLRQGANIQGPYQRENASPMGELSPVAPDSAELHALTVQENEYLIYWPVETPAVLKNEPAPAAAEPSAPPTVQSPPLSAAPSAVHNTYVYKGDGKFEKVSEESIAAAPANAYQQIQEMDAAPSENANRLRPVAAPSVSFAAEQTKKPLIGTRLYHAPHRQAALKRAHNPLMEVVDQQRYAAKYEAPGAVLPQNAELKDVSNPVDAFKRALQGLWQSSDAQQQAIEIMLDDPSMKSLLSKAMASSGKDATFAAMKTQLQDLEAERLMTLMRLDDAKKNLNAMKEEALRDIGKEQKRKINELELAEKHAKQALEAARQALEPLNIQCQEAAEKLAELQKPLSNTSMTLFVSPAIGNVASKKELLDRAENSMKAAGFQMEAGDALEMLTAYSLSDGIMEIRAQNECDAMAAYHAFTNALGCKIHESCRSRRIHVLETGDAPVFVYFADEKHPLVTSVYISSVHEDFDDYCKDKHYHSYPSLIVEPSTEIIPQSLPVFSPISKACVLKEMIQETPLNHDTLKQIQALRKALLAAGRSLALDSVKALCSFIACTQNELPGGVSEAIDRAVRIYAVPHIQMYKLPIDEVKNLLAAMPRTLKALNIE